MGGAAHAQGVPLRLSDLTSEHFVLHPASQRFSFTVDLPPVEGEQSTGLLTSVHLASMERSDSAVVDRFSAFALALTPDGAHLLTVNQDPDTSSSRSVASEPLDELLIFDAETLEVRRRVTVGDGPRGIAVTPDGRFILVVSQFINRLMVISGDTFEVVSTPAAGIGPYDVAVTPDGALAVVVNLEDASAWVYALDDFRVLRVVALEKDPFRVEISADGRYALITHVGSTPPSLLSLLDLRSFAVVGSVPLPGEVPLPAVDFSAAHAYVTFRRSPEALRVHLPSLALTPLPAPEGRYLRAEAYGHQRLLNARDTAGGLAVEFVAAGPAALRFGEVAGSVVDAAGTPLAGVRIGVGGVQGVADGAGEFQLAEVPLGVSVGVVAWREGFAPFRSNTAVEAGTPLQVTLQPSSGTPAAPLPPASFDVALSEARVVFGEPFAVQEMRLLNLTSAQPEGDRFGTIVFRGGLANPTAFPAQATLNGRGISSVGLEFSHLVFNLSGGSMSGVVPAQGEQQAVVEIRCRFEGARDRYEPTISAGSAGCTAPNADPETGYPFASLSEILGGQLNLWVETSSGAAGTDITDRVLVPVPDLARLDIRPAAAALRFGERLQLQAVTVFTNGMESDVTQLVDWVAASPEVLSINSAGRVSALHTPGTVPVEARLRDSTGVIPTLAGARRVSLIGPRLLAIHGSAAITVAENPPPQAAGQADATAAAGETRLLQLTATPTTLGAGERLTVSTEVAPPAVGVAVDAYLALLLPTGELLFYTRDLFSPFTLEPQPYARALGQRTQFPALLEGIIPEGLRGELTVLGGLVRSGAAAAIEQLVAPLEEVRIMVQ